MYRKTLLLLLLVVGQVACAGPGHLPEQDAGRSSAESEQPTQQLDEASARTIRPDHRYAELTLEMHRLNYALDSLEYAAERWPWLVSDETCLVLNRLEEQFLFLCEPGEESPFEPTQAEFRGKAVYRNGSELAQFGPQSAPHEAMVQGIVGTVLIYHPANEAFTGIAIENPYIYITSLEALIEVHPGFDASSSTEEWLSIFVHEFFHTRQFLSDAAYRVWGELLTQQIHPSLLTNLYLNDEAYQAAVDAEVELLTDAVRSGVSAEQAAAVLEQWLQMRDQRIEDFSKGYQGQDLQYEDAAFLYIEGLARYVEGTYLVDPGYHRSGARFEDPRYSGFADFSGKGYGAMISTTIPQGKYFYALGLHIGLLLDRIDPNWSKSIHAEPGWFLGAVRSQVE